MMVSALKTCQRFVECVNFCKSSLRASLLIRFLYWGDHVGGFSPVGFFKYFFYTVGVMLKITEVPGLYTLKG